MLKRIKKTMIMGFVSYSYTSKKKAAAIERVMKNQRLEEPYFEQDI
jgi:aminoglycoside phosphotransferase family enzyme